LRIIKSIIYITSIFIIGCCITSCRNNSITNVSTTEKEIEAKEVVQKKFNLEDHVKVDDRPILIYVIDKWTCFMCGPIYWNSVELVERVDTNSINKVLVFQYMREIERMKFLDDKFGINIDSNSLQIIYNDKAYSYLCKKYGKKQSFVLGFEDINSEPKFANNYQIGVYEEIVQFVNSANTFSTLVVPDYMSY
jgi:hypothetical protein